jgi:hypothetical protein
MKTDYLVRKAKRLAYLGDMPEGYRFGLSSCKRITDVMKVGNNIVVADRHGTLYKVTKKQLEDMVDHASYAYNW